MTQFLSVRERAAVVCLEALNRGLWDNHVALAFMSYCADDEDRVVHWEIRLSNIVDAEEEQLRAQLAVTDANLRMAEAFDASETAIRDFGEPEIQFGAITTGRTAKFGLDKRMQQ